MTRRAAAGAAHGPGPLLGVGPGPAVPRLGGRLVARYCVLYAVLYCTVLYCTDGQASSSPPSAPRWPASPSSASPPRSPATSSSSAPRPPAAASAARWRPPSPTRCTCWSGTVYCTVLCGAVLYCVLVSLAVASDSLLIAGLAAFLPKYAETQFQLSAGQIRFSLSPQYYKTENMLNQQNISISLHFYRQIDR